MDDLSKFGFCSEKVKPGGNINTVNLADEGKIDSDEFGESDDTKDCIQLQTLQFASVHFILSINPLSLQIYEIMIQNPSVHVYIDN